MECAALILIDLQKAIEDPKWRLYGERNNPDAEAVVASLLETWRKNGWPIYHVKHDSEEPESPYRPGQSGNDFQDFAQPLTGEAVIHKRTNSAFIGTDLERNLRSGGHTKLVICGVITNNSVEATVRTAGNLGFATSLVADGCYTFAKLDWNGTLRSAEQVHAMSLANLHGEYCTVLRASEL